MRTKYLSRLAGTFLVVALAAACGDAGPVATGDVDVTIQQTETVLAQVIADWSASVVSGEEAMVQIDPDTVEALTIRITTIEFLPQGSDEADNGHWVTLDLGSPVLLNLMSLPTESESPLVVASGTVEVGTYANVRLYTDSASVSFKGPISLGAAEDFDAGVDYPVDIPSVDQTGINTDITFTVEADAEGTANDVSLLFNAGSTFNNISATGTGRVTLTPVIHERGDGA